MIGGVISGISRNRFPENKKYNNNIIDYGFRSNNLRVFSTIVQYYMSVTNNMVVVKFIVCAQS